MPNHKLGYFDSLVYNFDYKLLGAKVFVPNLKLRDFDRFVYNFLKL